jgi:hypothetical protein
MKTRTLVILAVAIGLITVAYGIWSAFSNEGAKLEAQHAAQAAAYRSNLQADAARLAAQDAKRGIIHKEPAHPYLEDPDMAACRKMGVPESTCRKTMNEETPAY